MSLFEKQGYNQAQPQQKSTSLFKGIEEATSSQRDPRIEPGVYPILAVDSISAFWSERQKTNFFLATFEILESNVPDHPAGTRVCWMKDFKNDVTLGLVKQLAAAILGVSIEEITEDICEKLVASDNPANGRLVHCAATSEVSKGGNTYTKCAWSPLPEDLQKQLQELRDKAGFPF
jgi:hypothetical protein